MGMNEAGNPYRCPCCWDCGSTMPFSYESLDCPDVSYTGDTTRWGGPDWAVPSFTPKCKAEWDATGRWCVYYSILVGNECCSAVFGQYCIDDPDGTNGRAWVVEYWCHNATTGETVNSNTRVLDWLCTCGCGDDGMLGGAGARFSFSLTVGGCCCETCGSLPDCSCNPPATLYADIGYGSGAETVTLVESAPNWGGGALLGCIGNLTLYCSAGEWKLDIVDQLGICPTETITATTGTCSPFSLDFTFTPPSCFGCSDGTLAITVTE